MNSTNDVDADSAHRPGPGPGSAANARAPSRGPRFDLPENRFAVRLLQTWAVLFGRAYHHTDVLAPQRLPRRGPAILVCNHTSGLDPLLIQAVCPRAIVWMMASEYYEIKAMKWLYETIDAIPVDRSRRDMAATRSAMRALASGRILGIFPEGRIEPTRDLLPFQGGVSMLATKNRVAVYPAYLEGSQRAIEMVPAILPPQDATLAFGPPLQFHRGDSSREDLDHASERIRRAVEDLRTFTLRVRSVRGLPAQYPSGPILSWGSRLGRSEDSC